MAETNKSSAVSPEGKQKRKNPHPVRKYFQYESATQQRCRFCNWVSRENATRMVRHIAVQCKKAGPSVRHSMQMIMLEAKDRESNSGLIEHKKKDIHRLFIGYEDDKKRQCSFCNWTTTLNLTRMRNHIISVCKEVPAATRNYFIKGDGVDECSFHIVNMDTDDRKDLQIVRNEPKPKKSNELDRIMMDVAEERNQEYGEEEERYFVYGDLDAESERHHEKDSSEKESSRRQLIAQVIIEGKEMAQLEVGEEEAEDDAPIDPEESDEDNDYEQSNEQVEIEVVEFGPRECHWCWTEIDSDQDVVVVDRKTYCSIECKSKEESTMKIAEQTLEKARSRSVSPKAITDPLIARRAYSKKIMPQERSGNDEPPVKKEAPKSDFAGQISTRQPSVHLAVARHASQPPLAEDTEIRKEHAVLEPEIASSSEKIRKKNTTATDTSYRKVVQASATGQQV